MSDQGVQLGGVRALNWLPANPVEVRMVYGELKRKELVGEVTCTVPPSVAAPVTLTRSELVPDTSTKYVAAAVNTRLPLTVSVPIDFPAATVPPLMLVLPPPPLPPS